MTKKNIFFKSKEDAHHRKYFREENNNWFLWYLLTLIAISWNFSLVSVTDPCRAATSITTWKSWNTTTFLSWIDRLGRVIEIKDQWSIEINDQFLTLVRCTSNSTISAPFLPASCSEWRVFSRDIAALQIIIIIIIIKLFCISFIIIDESHLVYDDPHPLCPISSVRRCFQWRAYEYWNCLQAKVDQHLSNPCVWVRHLYGKRKGAQSGLQQHSEPNLDNNPVNQEKFL